MIGKDNECYLCGRTTPLHLHHIFFGTANRKKSDKYGLTCKLCLYCHTEGKNAVHRNAETNIYLRKMGQRYAMIELDWDIEKFRKEIGRNYLEEMELEYIEDMQAQMLEDYMEKEYGNEY